MYPYCAPLGAMAGVARAERRRQEPQRQDPKASSNRSTKTVCPFRIFRHASALPNQAARSISGKVPRRPERGGHSISKVLLRMRLARRSDLEARSIQARGELLEGMRAETIEQAESILDAIDRGSLEAELIALKSRFEDVDGRGRDLFSARNRAEDRIASVGGDAAVAILDAKRRTVLLNIEDRALAYLRLKLGTAAADRALRAYRDRHRSSMMKRASEAFALISRGA
jgi:hypothetical protein